MKNKMAKFLAVGAAVCTLFASALSLAGCNYCAHDLEVIEKVASTCIEHGHSYSYKCRKCDGLFGYSSEKGLYAITEAEELPLAEHTVSDKIGTRVKDGKDAATSLFDFEITTECALCEEEFVLSGEKLIPFSPTAQTLQDSTKTRRTYDAVRSYDENEDRYVTTAKLFKLAKKTDVTPVNYVNDPDWVGKYGASQRMPLYIPFMNDVPRQLVMFIHNKSAITTLNFEWSIDEKTYGGAIVAPGEYKSFIVTGMRGETNAAGMLLRYSNANGSETLGETFEVELAGYYYTGGTVENITVDAQPVKLQYTAGEIFDPTGVKLFAAYSEPYVTKTLIPKEYTYDLNGVPLKVTDTKVVFSYGGKSVSVPITVTEGGE